MQNYKVKVPVNVTMSQCLTPSLKERWVRQNFRSLLHIENIHHATTVLCLLFKCCSQVHVTNGAATQLLYQ